MIRFLINRPIAILISFLAVAALGVFAFSFVPTSLMPDIDIPQVIVKVRGENFSAAEVEQRLIEPIRNNLKYVNGVKRLETTAMPGSGYVVLTFEVGTRTSLGFIEVNEKVDAVLGKLPRDIERPVVTKAKIGDIPAFNLNISRKAGGHSLSWIELSNLIRLEIKPRIENMKGIAMADLSGTSKAAIELSSKGTYLKAIGIDNETLISALRQNNIEIGSISVTDGDSQYALTLSSGPQTAESLGNLLLNISGRIFKLSDLFDIKTKGANGVGEYYFNKQRSISLEIIKYPNYGMSELKTDFGGLVAELKRSYPQLTFEISQDQTHLLDFAVTNLEQELAIGAILAILLMLLFIRKIRAAILIGITVPISLIIAVLGFYFCGMSFNIVSLGGLILGLGMIIDNSIVIIDSINTRKNEGMSVEDAVVNGTSDVLRPLITSVFTNTAVFLPLIFLNGLTGALYFDQAISIIIGIVSSLLVSILLLPTLYKLIYTRNTLRSFTYEIPKKVNITVWYEWGLKAMFRKPYIAIVIVFVCGVTTILLFNLLKKDRLPPITRTDTLIKMDWNENIDLNENQRRVQSLLHFVGSASIESSCWLGIQQYSLALNEDLGPNQCKIYLKTESSRALSETQNRIADFLKVNYPNALLSHETPKNAFDQIFADQMPPLRVKIRSKDHHVLPDLSSVKIYKKNLVKLFPAINIEPVPTITTYILSVNTLKTSIYGLTNQEIIRKMEDSGKPVTIGNFQDGHTTIPVSLTPPMFSDLNNLLSNVIIKNSQGTELPLSNFVDLKALVDYQLIHADNAGLYYGIDLNSAEPEKDFAKVLKLGSKDFSGLEFFYEGAFFENKVLVKEMVIILTVSVLLLYFILAAQFESLVQPLFVILELPIAMSGAILFLFLAGNTINLMSLIGIIVMSGFIINDSILKIDAINQLRKKGTPLLMAIFKGGERRLKPIVMISLTCIISLLPSLFMKDMGSEIQKPLVLALMGGMFVGMFVSLFIMPLLYWTVYKNKRINAY